MAQSKTTKRELLEALNTANSNTQLMQENIWELEQELIGWQVLSSENNLEFSRSGLDTIARQSLVYWLRNPLIHRIPYLMAFYVFGQNLNVKAENENIDEVVQGVWTDKGNLENFTSQAALIQKECELEINGNLFFALFVNEQTGQIKIRNIPFAEIREIITNPEDRSEVWFYKRSWTANQFNAGTGFVTPEQRETFYADYRLYGKLSDKQKPPKFNDKCYIYHVKVNALSNMLFGVSELYCATAWAKSYKEFLENWSAVAKALARFAWRGQFPGGSKAIASAKTKLTAKDSTNTYSATNAGGVAIGSPETVFEAINKSGALPDPAGGRRLLLMVCAGVGIYEHYFGDPSTGNLATAKSMERPMELMFRARQSLWRSVILDILNFAIDCDIKATMGKIKGISKQGDNYVLPNDPATGNPISREIAVDFPDILEHDITSRVSSLVSAITLNGSPDAGTIPDKEYQTELLLRALGEPDSGGIAADLHETDKEEVPIPASEQAMTEALRELKESLKQIYDTGKDK